MVCFVLQVLLLLGGAAIMITGRLPAIPVGGARVRVAPQWARLAGLLLMLPIPGILAVVFLLGVYLGEAAEAYLPLVEVGVPLFFVGAALVLLRIVAGRATTGNELAG